MHRVVVCQPAWQLLDHGLRVGSGVDADVVALEGADERLGHAVGLRTADRRRERHQADVAGEGAGITRGVAAAVVGQHVGEAEGKRRCGFPEKGNGALLGFVVLDGQVDGA